jgi:hypothetical protein
VSELRPLSKSDAGYTGRGLSDIDNLSEKAAFMTNSVGRSRLNHFSISDDEKNM